MVQKYVDKAISSPLFHAGINLLSIDDARQGPKAALQGLLAGKQVQQQMAQQKQAQAEAERKKAAMAALGQQVPGLQPYIGTGIEGQAMTMLAKQQAGVTAPSNVREWEYFSNLTPEQQRKYITMKRASQLFRMGDVTMENDPLGGGATVAGSPVAPIAAPSPIADPTAVASDTVPTPAPLTQPEVQAMLTSQEAEKEGAKTRAKKEAEEGVKREIAQPKALAKLESAKRSAQNVLGAIKEAKESTGTFTTGLLGSMTRGIPGTPAFDLVKTVETVKANLGFDRLQQMRDESPTGGALGQVAVQELEALQSTVRNLDTGQGTEQMMAALEKIEQHYNNYLEALDRSYQRQYAPPSGGSDINALVNKYAD